MLGIYQLDDVYAGFDHTRYPLDLQGWRSQHPIFAELIARYRPRSIIEVGTWKGGSAIHMAGLTKEHCPGARIVCVDTWLGAQNFLFPDSHPDVDLHRLHGWPMVYYQFLANVCHTGHQDVIVPFPTTSLIAARFLAAGGHGFDMIYIDGSHDTQDVFHDLEHYLPLLRDGGVMFGDDYDMPSVRTAVDMFINIRKRPMRLTPDGVMWVSEEAASQEAPGG